MMRWFKHMALSNSDEILSQLMDEFGTEGYGVWWLILEKIAQLMDESDRTFARFSLKVWSKFVRISPKKFQKLVKFLEKNEVFFTEFEDGYLTINCPNLLKYRDEWTERQTKKKAKTRELLGSNSGETPVQDTDTEADTEIENDKCRVPRPPKPYDFKSEAIEVLQFLNLKTNKNFDAIPGNLTMLMARLKEGATVADCKMIIAARCREWLGNNEFKQYLRPKTLFNRTNFAQYKGELVEIKNDE